MNRIKLNILSKWILHHTNQFTGSICTKFGIFWMIWWYFNLNEILSCYGHHIACSRPEGILWSYTKNSLPITFLLDCYFLILSKFVEVYFYAWCDNFLTAINWGGQIIFDVLVIRKFLNNFFFCSTSNTLTNTTNIINLDFSTSYGEIWRFLPNLVYQNLHGTKGKNYNCF